MAVLAQLVDPNAIGVLQEAHVVRIDLTEDANAQAGAGERMTAQELGIEPHLAADPTHLILEEHAQRLDNLELHVVEDPPRCGGS